MTRSFGIGMLVLVLLCLGMGRFVVAGSSQARRVRLPDARAELRFEGVAVTADTIEFVEGGVDAEGGVAVSVSLDDGSTLTLRAERMTLEREAADSDH